MEPAVEGLDGVSHIVLQDYVEHVAGFAVGSASVLLIVTLLVVSIDGFKPSLMTKFRAALNDGGWITC